MKMWRKGIPGRGSSLCKGPEAGQWLVVEGAGRRHVAGVECTRRKEGGGGVGASRGRLFRALWDSVRARAFIPKELGDLTGCGQRRYRTRDSGAHRRPLATVGRTDCGVKARAGGPGQRRLVQGAVLGTRQGKKAHGERWTNA